MKILTDAEIKDIVDHAFDEPFYLDHKPTQWDMELYLYHKVLEAQLKKEEPC